MSEVIDGIDVPYVEDGVRSTSRHLFALLDQVPYGKWLRLPGTSPEARATIRRAVLQQIECHGAPYVMMEYRKRTRDGGGLYKTVSFDLYLTRVEIL